jgi:hypothetical protein
MYHSVEPVELVAAATDAVLPDMAGKDVADVVPVLQDTEDEVAPVCKVDAVSLDNKAAYAAVCNPVDVAEPVSAAAVYAEAESALVASDAVSEVEVYSVAVAALEAAAYLVVAVAC